MIVGCWFASGLGIGLYWSLFLFSVCCFWFDWIMGEGSRGREYWDLLVMMLKERARGCCGRR